MCVCVCMSVFLRKKIKFFLTTINIVLFFRLKKKTKNLNSKWMSQKLKETNIIIIMKKYI
jgi:hypothetical protein